MREILFRGKRMDNGEWVSSGNLIHFNDDNQYYIPAKNAGCTCTHDNEDNIIEWNEVLFYKVDPSTVGQYTGLTDKNGVKIFEGDIVSHEYTKITDEVPEDLCIPYMAETKKKNYEIRWDSTDSYCGYRYHNGRNIFPFKKGTVINGNDEVIGNIHDNPELVERGSNERT